MKPNEVRFEGEIAYIQLTRGFEAIIDAVDYPLIKDARWALMKTNAGTPYAGAIYRTSNGESRSVYLHRLLLNPVGSLRHINGNGLDNRRENLEPIEKQTRIRPKRYRGVKETAEGFEAVIRTQFNPESLGTYETAEDAARAYDKAAKEAFGEKAKLNFAEV